MLNIRNHNPLLQVEPYLPAVHTLLNQNPDLLRPPETACRLLQCK